MNLVAAFFLFFVFSSSPAHAYVDPGTASIALQALIGGIAAAGLFFRTRISAFLSRFRRGKADTGDKEDASTFDSDER